MGAQMKQGIGRSLALSFGALVALGSIPSQAGDKVSKDEKSIMEMDRAWAKVAATKDVDRIVAFYADDASMFPPNAPAAKGKDALKKAWTELVNMPGISLSWEPNAAVTAKSGDLAYTSGTYQLSATGPDGKPIADKGKYVEVWRKDSTGKWKVAADIYNSDLPPAPPKQG